MSFIKALAHESPLPGGGAAAAHCGACAAALIHKVIMVWRRNMDGNQDFPNDRMQEKAGTLMDAFSDLQEQDQQAYRRLSREKSSDTSGKRWQQALPEAIETPIRIMERSLQGMDALWQIACLSPRFLRADLLVCAELLAAAHHGAAHIARANSALFEAPSKSRIFNNRISELNFAFGGAYAKAKEALCGISPYSLSRAPSD